MELFNDWTIHSKYVLNRETHKLYLYDLLIAAQIDGYWNKLNRGDKFVKIEIKRVLNTISAPCESMDILIIR